MSAVKVVIEEALCAYEFFRVHGHSDDEIKLYVRGAQILVHANLNFEIYCGDVDNGDDALKALDLWPYALREWRGSVKGDLAKQRTRIWEGSAVSRDYVTLSKIHEECTRYIIP